MSTENIDNIASTSDDNLDTFADNFFGQKTSDAESGQDSEVEEVKDQAEADAPTKEVTQTDEETVDLEDDEQEEEDTDETEDKDKAPVKKMSRAEKRISELNAKFREEQRQRIALEEQVNRILAGQNKDNATENTTTESSPVEPSPDDKNEDGTDKYPLGELDPSYIRALVRFEQATIREEETKKVEAERQAQAAEAARNAALQDWNVKLEQAKQEKYPDFTEKSEVLLETIGDIDDTYGEYLSSTIMDMDNGVDVLYYLADNPEEAGRIVDLGPRKATIALGRLHASFSTVEDSTPNTNVKKVSKAPTPPPVNKGSSPVKAVAPDTDDLDAFSSLLFKGK